MEKAARTVDCLWQSGKSCASLWEARVEHFLGWRCVAGNGSEAASEQAFYTRELWRLKVDECYRDFSPTNTHQTAVNIEVAALR
jgi:hypothetical protein